MDMQKLIDDLEMIERTIPDYSEGRRRGLTDIESEITASVAIGKAVEALEELQNQKEVLLDTVNMLSPLMVENRKLKEKQIPKPPVEKVHPKHKKLGKMHYCECGVLFYGWGNPEEETNYCGNCGQKLKGDE